MYIEDFLPTQAFPIATILILICSSCTYYSGIKHKIENPDSDFVDLDFAIIYTPMMLLGTKLGTIFNKIVSSFILFLILIFILITSFQKSYKRYLILFFNNDRFSIKCFNNYFIVKLQNFTINLY